MSRPPRALRSFGWVLIVTAPLACTSDPGGGAGGAGGRASSVTTSEAGAGGQTALDGGTGAGGAGGHEPLDGGPEAEAGDDGGCKLDAPAWGKGGSLMLPGSDCGSCHAAAGSAAALPFSVSGTVFVSATCPEPTQAVVHVVDDVGQTLDLATNAAGNFYATQALVLPLTVSVEVGGVVTPMVGKAPSGSCGVCHTGGGGVIGWVSPAP